MRLTTSFRKETDMTPEQKRAFEFKLNWLNKRAANHGDEKAEYRLEGIIDALIIMGYSIYPDENGRSVIIQTDIDRD